jgi:hypothetical protein
MLEFFLCAGRKRANSLACVGTRTPACPSKLLAKAGAICSHQTAWRGGGQPEVSDGEPRGEAESPVRPATTFSYRIDPFALGRTGRPIGPYRCKTTLCGVVLLFVRIVVAPRLAEMYSLYKQYDRSNAYLI